MFPITRIVPTTVLTVAALVLVAPAAQARPFIAPSGGATYVNPSVQSTQDFKVYSTQRSHRDTGAVVVTTGDKPLPNPVQLPTAAVSVPDSSGNSFDWTAAALGAALGGSLTLMLAGGVGFRRRGQQPA